MFTFSFFRTSHPPHLDLPTTLSFFHPCIKYLNVLPNYTASARTLRLQCNLQSLWLSSTSPFLEAIAFDTTAAAVPTLVRLPLEHLHLHATKADVFFFISYTLRYRPSLKESCLRLRICRRLPRRNHFRERTEKSARTWNRYAVLTYHHRPDTHGPCGYCPSEC